MADRSNKFYNQYSEDEWNRLHRDAYHRLEFDTTMHFLNKYLPDQSTILDVGGGPGRYSIELAKLGHKVLLTDLATDLLQIAEQKIEEFNVQENIIDVR